MPHNWDSFAGEKFFWKKRPVSRSGSGWEPWNIATSSKEKIIDYIKIENEKIITGASCKKQLERYVTAGFRQALE
jgi:hypothetical protein